MSQILPEAIAAYNQRLATDPRVLSLVLPLGDGVSLAVKRP
jgi:predicted O-methyltransferase YrrM